MSRADESPTREPAVNDRLVITQSWLLMASASFFFIPFFVAFAMLAVLNNRNMWRPAGVTHPSMALGIASVALLVASGLAYLWAQAGLKRGVRGQMTAGATLALVLALAAALCYALTLNHMGFGFQSGGYASVFFGLTFVYEVSLVSLCVFLFGIANRARLGLYTPDHMAAVTAFAEFWWWFIIVGVFAYLLLYVVPFINLEAGS